MHDCSHVHVHACMYDCSHQMSLVYACSSYSTVSVQEEEINLYLNYM